MNKQILLTLISALMIPSLVFAKDHKLSKSEFLTKYDNGEISLEKTPLMENMPPELLTQLIAGQKKEFPSLKDEMFFAGYVDSNDFRYAIFFEYYDRGCVFGVSDKKAFVGLKKGSEQGKRLAEAERESYEKIDKRYCEKALGLTNLSDRGLVRVTVPRDVIKSKDKKGNKK